MNHEKLSSWLARPRVKKWIGVLCVLLFVPLYLALAWVVGRPLVNFVSEPEQFREWVDSYGFWGRAAFVGMVVLQMLVAIIPGEPLELVSGYAFGFWEGTALCLAGILIGSALIFAFVRRFGVKVVELFYPVEKIRSMKFLQNTRRLNRLVFLVFFIPGTPKDILTYFIGLTRMRFSTWMLIAGIARIPSVVTSVLGGNVLNLQLYKHAAVILAVTLTLSGIGALIYRRISRSSGEGK
ncbi:MAG: VTT domain-containing protein [Peptococcaceae bacterium]|nr:VTT domain-containing protein [Peptococcaceae bacterium]